MACGGGGVGRGRWPAAVERRSEEVGCGTWPAVLERRCRVERLGSGHGLRRCGRVGARDADGGGRVATRRGKGKEERERADVWDWSFEGKTVFLRVVVRWRQKRKIAVCSQPCRIEYHVCYTQNSHFLLAFFCFFLCLNVISLENSEK